MSGERSDTPTDGWQPVPHIPPLEEDAVHVWLLRVGADDATLDGLRRGAREPQATRPALALEGAVSQEEAARARQMIEPARTRFLRTRHALRTRLAGYLGCSPDAVGFAYGDMGKPTLLSGAAVQFSVAHSGDHALLAFARGAPVGVDLERVRPVARRARVAARVLAADSAAALARVPAAERDEAFIWAWTQREAYVKAIGGGVLRSPDPLPFLWPPRSCECEGWSIAPLPVGAGHQACLVVHGSGRRLQLLRPR